MLTLTRRKLPVPAAIMDDYENNLECSFAEEYCGPPVSYDIPHIDPVDVNRIPIAYSASSPSPFDELAIPVVQPILKFENLNKELYKWSKTSGKFVRGGFHSSGRIVPCNTVEQIPDGVKNDEEQPVEVSEGSGRSGIEEISDIHESNQAFGSSEIDILNENPEIGMERSESVQHLNSEIREHSLSSPNSSAEIVECEEVSELGTGSSGIEEISDSHELNQASGSSDIDNNVNENPEIGMERSKSVQRLNSEIREHSLSSPNSSVEIVECEEVSQGTGSSGIEKNSDSNESNQASGSSDTDHVNENPETGMERSESVPHLNSEITEHSLSSSNSSTEIVECEESEDEHTKSSSYRGGKRTSLVTFVELKESVKSSERGSPDVMENVNKKPVIRSDVKKGLCYRCGKGNWLAEKESCIVCAAKYCRSCLLRAMGSMSEGRKCITCIGYQIDDSNRASLGKPSRMLKRLLTQWEVKRVMSAELSCEANQLAPHLICVNSNPLSLRELTALKNCRYPPKKLKPGIYWYDKETGFWGKEGHKPSQIISPLLDVGGAIKRNASNGNTTVVINNREITKTELWMLKRAGLNCEGNTNFWMTADGSFQEEGQKVVRERLWDKPRVKLVCAALSLPIPPQYFSETTHNSDEVVSEHLPQNFISKILLVGCDQSGTSTIFKQAKILYNVPFSEAERQCIKFMIQSNLYGYITIILESRAMFEEDRLQELRTQRIREPGPSVYPDEVEETTEYSISQSLQAFSDLLIQVQLLGNMEAFFPAASEDYAQLVEELLHSTGFQATYNRINELNSLPKIANYFLDRAVEISRAEYEPSEMDIVYADGINSYNGVASMEFSFPMSSQNGFTESIDQNDPSMRYQLITVQASNLGQNCKWLQMFEDVDLVLFCVSLTDYNDFYVDSNGTCINKMLASRALLETMITHPDFANKSFHLLLTKFDLLEKNLERAPLSQCDWFQDFNPVVSNHPLSSSSSKYSNPSLAQRAFHYIAVKFKRLFSSLTGRKLYVSSVKELEADSVHEALTYGREILKWELEETATTLARNEFDSESIEGSTTIC